MALPEDILKEDDNDFFDYAGDILAAPFRGVEGAVQGAYNLADYLSFDVLPDYDTRFLGTSKTMAGGAVEGISQFATGFIPLFGLAGRAGALAKAGTVTKGVVAGAATDFTFFNGQEARLSNLIQQVPELQNPVTEFLAYDGDESELEGRMKNVLEGLGLEAVAGTFIAGLKAIKRGRKVKEEGGTAEQQAQVVNDTLEGGKALAREDIAEPGLSRRSGIFAGRIDEKTKDFLLKGRKAEEEGRAIQTGGAPVEGVQKAATVRNTLDELSKNADTPEVQQLAKDLNSIIKDEADQDVRVFYKPEVSEGDITTVRGGDDDMGSITGVYKPSEDRIELYEGADEQTLVHEILHGVTAKKINAWVSQGGADRSLVLSNIDNVINNKAAPKPIRELAKSFKLASEKIKDLYAFEGKDVFDPTVGKGVYEFKDLDEFLVGAFTDLKLQQILRRIPSDDKRSIFQKIVDAVYQLFGVKGDSTLLNKVIRDSAQIISASRGSYMGKAKLVAEGRYYQEVSKFGKSVTSSELDEFRTQQKIPEIKLRKTGAHPTQIATTKATYEKVKPQLKEGSTIDFGAGKNIAVKAGIKADSFEPFPEKGFQPTFKDSSKIPSNSYDNVINNAVLNVVPQDIRNNLVREIGRILKVGGKAFINVRGKDVFDSKHTLISKENMEVIVDSTGAYQKGFTKEELVGYLSEVLGDGFDVKVSTKFGTVAAEVTKRADEGLASVKRPSDLPDFKKGKEDEFLSAIPEKFRGFAEALMKPGATPRLPQFALETGEDVLVLKDILEKYYKENPDKITVSDVVSEVDEQIEKTVRMQAKEGEDAEKVLRDVRITQQAYREQGKSLVHNISDIVKEFDEGVGGTIAATKLKNAFQQLLTVADVYRRIGRETAITLQARRENFSKNKIGLSEADTAIEELRNEFVNSTDMDIKRMVELVKEHIDPNDVEGSLDRLLKTTKKAQGKHFLDMPTEYWMNSILSGPKTQMVNIVGNGLTQVISTLEAVAGGLSTGNMDVVKAVFASWSDWKMFTEAFKFSKKAFKEQDNLLDPANRSFEEAQRGAITGQRASEAPIIGGMVSDSAKESIDALGNIIRIPSRLLLSTDEFFKQLAYRRAARLKSALSGIQQGIRDPKALAEHINKTIDGIVTEGGRMMSKEGLVREATEIANKRGLKGKEKAAFIIKYKDDNFNPDSSALMQYAAEEAQYLTFTKELQDKTLGKALQDATNKVPYLRLILPFVRTPTNILKFAAERTPAAVLMKEERQRFFEDYKSGDPMRIARANGKVLTGGLAAGVMIETVFNNRDNITGGGPSNEREKEALMATGWRPYSIRIGDTYYSYQRLDPIATLLGIAADIVEVGVREEKSFDESGAEHATNALILSLTRNFTNKSYLAGIQMWADALGDPDRYVEKLGRNYAGSFVPNVLSQMADYDSQAIKEVRSITDAVKRKLGLRGSLDTKRNLLGEEYMAEQWMGTGFINPIRMSTKKDDPILNEMASLNHAFRNPPPSLGGQIDLLEYENDKGQSAYDRQLELLKTVKIRGLSLRQTLNKLIKSKNYQKLSPESEPGLESPRIQQINSILTKYRKEARRQMLREFPELNAQYAALTKARAGLRGGMQREEVLELLSQTN
jgi:SAM-dependent methyltransferase